MRTYPSPSIRSSAPSVEGALLCRCPTGNTDRTTPSTCRTAAGRTSSSRRAPIWCSTDLRDGNQALESPMDSARKRRFFDLLVRLGFKEIEVGFPAASKTDFDFVRSLVDEDTIPEDVTIEVLTQARPELIERTFEAIDGARQAIVHLYNSTSVTQRRVVFRLDKAGIVELAVRGTALCKQLAGETSTDVVLQYSPESFHHTELDYAHEICEAVAAEWEPDAGGEDDRQPADDGRALPAQRLRRPHGMVRAALLPPRLGHPLRAPAQRPRNGGGNGRARADGRRRARRGHAVRQRRADGNVDLVTLALNLLTQGIDPGLDFSQLDEAKRIVEECNELPVHPRHPWAGELVYTAFSGSHQDAIKKGMYAWERSGSEVWDVPYLPIDPEGRRPLVRGDHPRQLAVRQGRRRLPAAQPVRPRPAARPPGRVRAEGAGDHRRRGRRARRVRSSTTSSASSISTSASRTSSSRTGTRRVTRRRSSPRRCGPATSRSRSTARATARSPRSCTRSRSGSGSRSACATTTSTR